MRLVKATELDIDFLVDLRRLTMTDQFRTMGIVLSAQENLQRVQSYFDQTYIILDSGEKIGMVKYIDSGNAVEVIQFQILPLFQRKGIGTMVLDQICSEAKSRGKEIQLNVLKNNGALKLYQRIGFVIVDSDEKEYFMEYKK